VVYQLTLIKGLKNISDDSWFTKKKKKILLYHKKILFI